MKTRKVPMRMCVGCRVMKPKKELLRVVRQAEGSIHFDTTGKAAGRGAYICPQKACLEKAMKAKLLERALECRIEPDVYQQLEGEIEQAHE